MLKAIHAQENRIVVPAVPVRQWVLSLPKRLRWHLHRDPALTPAVLRLFLRAVERTLLAHSEKGWAHFA